MCGIVGVAGNPKAIEIVTTGLQHLEYRGYDSAGVAALDDSGTLHTCKAVGKIAALMEKIPSFTQRVGPTTTAIGHTRWATHGAPTTSNAHPHIGQFGSHVLGLVHNGIIENHAELRSALSAKGAQFVSQTDTETLPYALADLLHTGAPNLTHALHTLLPTLRGNFAVVVLAQSTPDELWGTRRGAPLCVGVGNGANYLVSDPLALAGVCEQFIFLHDDDVVHITSTSIEIFADGQLVTRAMQIMDLSTEAKGKQGYRHFMLKEIHEQPAVLARILQEHTNAESLLPELPLPPEMLNPTSINIIACGTAHYATQVGKYFIEQLARVPVNADVASEFRYRNPPYLKGGLFIAVSQSGETADTLAALEHAKAAGQHILVFTNVPTSSMARAAHAVVPLLAGREIAVASTKAFSAMVASLLLFALQMGAARGHIASAQVQEVVQALRELPFQLQEQLEHTEAVQNLASRFANLSPAQRSMLYLARGALAPTAYEGAHKIMECSYLHAQAYPSGEPKHGAIALVEPGMFVLNLAASNDGLFEKTLSNMQEIAARHGEIVLITDTEGATHVPPSANTTVLTVPTTHPLLLPLVFSIPLQLLAYHTATQKGTDVDQPRNLAKSVTVE